MSIVLPKTATTVTNPFLTAPPRIEGLIPELADVPTDADEWLLWRDRVRAYRELTRRKTIKSKHEQRVEMTLCQRDPAYWLTMYGVIFEPREVAGNPPSWYPWVPFPFQVQMIRWIQDVMSRSDNGRGDGIVEKSRDMGASWLFCAYMIWEWLFSPVFIGGVVSRNAEAVDKTGATDTLFYKLRSLAGINMQVPERLRLPPWMVPAGMTEDHSMLRVLQHPSKTCVIYGETTTELAGVGGRSTMRLNDEMARAPEFQESWANQANTTTHRFGVSSADQRNPNFRQLAELGRAGLSNEHAEAPSYLRLDWWVHPFHTPEWLEQERARNINDLPRFGREYLIDYNAGSGDNVYPRFSDIDLGSFPYEPGLGNLYCAIDPGVRDPTAIVWIQEDQIRKRYRVLTSFEGVGGEDVDFIASILVGIPISGAGGFDYRRYPGLIEMMDWTANLNRQVIYFGDPYGNHRGGDGKRSFYEGLRQKTAELTGGRNVVHVRTVTADDARSFMRRKKAVNMLSYRMDFNDSLGASAVLTALKESRYPERKEGRGYVTEVLEPQHDRWSHIRSAVEFWAVNVEQEQVVNMTPLAKPVVKSMSGRIIR